MREALVIHRPARDFQIAEADVDPFAARGYDRGDLARGAHQLGGGALPIASVEAEEHIGVAEDVLHHAQVERMPARKVEPPVYVPHRRAERLSELHQCMEAGGLT